MSDILWFTITNNKKKFFLTIIQYFIEKGKYCNVCENKNRQ